MRLRNIPGSDEVIAVSEYVVREPEQNKGNWKELFGNENPIELEIGIGKGRYLMDMAGRHPERNFLGIERYSSVLLRAIQKAEQRVSGAALPLNASVRKRPHRPEGCNFRFLRFDAAELPLLFEQGEISRIYLNFSDPWPKDRHAHRRLTSERFLERYEQILDSGCGIVFKTDNRDLFEFSLEEIRRRGWELKACTFDLHGAGESSSDSAADSAAGCAEISAGSLYADTVEVLTEYEEKFAAKGNPICMLAADRR
ncbi:MAG: tRNA (guanosine(46)-N7)-methyltransferase TrmB [Eubacterium sp.]|nr:tRNA (guanosine(46)-N7)-methyltransferase TrmB [Eubacterium sp.]